MRSLVGLVVWLAPLLMCAPAAVLAQSASEAQPSPAPAPKKTAPPSANDKAPKPKPAADAPAKTTLSDSDAAVVRAMQLLTLLDLLKDYELFSEDKPAHPAPAKAR
jgi:hypothetical protein